MNVATAERLRVLADEMKAAQDAARSLPPFTSRPGGLDLAGGYRIAQIVHAERLKEGLVPVGRKIGFTNRSIWDVYDVHQPIWGYMYDTTVMQAREGRATCRLGKMAAGPKIEPEIAFHFRAAPRGRTAEEILASVDWVAHGFEIVQSHFPGWKFKVADTVADQGLHGMLVVGEPRPIEALGPDVVATLADFRVSLLRDGELQEEGYGRNALGNPLAAVAHLVAVLREQPGCAPIAAGEIVTTGTLTAALPIAAGERWSTTIAGLALPGLAVEFAR